MYEEYAITHPTIIRPPRNRRRHVARVAEESESSDNEEGEGEGEGIDDDDDDDDDPAAVYAGLDDPEGNDYDISPYL